MSVNITITTAGRAAIVNAENTGTDPLTITQVGISATAVTPTVGAVALAGEIKRISGVAGEVVAADTIHINMTDDSSDAYSLRSFALYLADGTLFGIYGQADPLIVKTAASIAAIAIDTIFADIDAAALTFGNAEFTNPPATTERAGVVELATLAEAQAGIDALRALAPAQAKAAVLGWLLSQDGSGSGLDADLLDGYDSAAFVKKAGDALSGFLTLHADPTAAMHAATRQWVLAQIATGALGYTPVDKAGDTMLGMLSLFANPTLAAHAANKQYVDGLVTAAALLAKILTLDGSGSGLDADLLDGQDGAYYTNVAARLGFNPVNRAGDTMTGLLRLSGAPTLTDHATTKAYVDALLTAVAIRSKLLTVDGSGSGIDADLLDGLHASEFVRSVDSGNYGSDAYGYWERRPNGVWEMWGKVLLPYASNVVSVNITFPDGGFPAETQWIGGNADGPANAGWHPVVVMAKNITKLGCTLVADSAKSDQTIVSPRYVMWRAIGI